MANNNSVVQSVKFYELFIVAKYSAQQTVKQVFVRHHARVYLHHRRWNKRRLLQHLFEFNHRKSARRPTSTRLSISQETSGQPRCGNLYYILSNLRYMLYISTQVSRMWPRKALQMECSETLPQPALPQLGISPTLPWTDADSLTLEQTSKDLGISDTDLDPCMPQTLV